MNEAAFLILFPLDTCSHLSLAWTLRLTLCCGSQHSRVRGSSQEGVRLGRKAQRKLVLALNRMKEVWLYRGAGDGKKSWTTLGCDLYSLYNQQILVITGQCLSMCSILWSEVREGRAAKNKGGNIVLIVPSHQPILFWVNFFLVSLCPLECP